NQPPNLPWKSWVDQWQLRYMLARLSIGYRQDYAAYGHIDKANAEGVLIGGYHALLPAYNSAYYDPIRQADAFLKVLDKTKVKVAMLDIEVPNITTDTIVKWCDYFDANSDLPLILYGNDWYLNQLLKPNTRF